MLASTVHAAPVITYFPARDLGVFLAKNFDLASIRSSFGPRRSPTQRTFADFQMKPSTATDNLLEFESADWLYQLRIVERRDVNGDGIEDLAVCFTDQALGGPTSRTQTGLLITRYSVKGYAVALSFSVDACDKPMADSRRAPLSDAAGYERSDDLSSRARLVRLEIAPQRRRPVQQQGTRIAADDHQHNDGGQIRQHRQELRRHVQPQTLAVEL